MNEIREYIKNNPNINIHIDSRLIEYGDIFVARKGLNVDGHSFIENAIDLGAKIIVYSKNIEDKILQKNKGIVFIKTDDFTKSIPEILKIRYKIPKNIFYFTGTNGKTSMVHFCRSICENINIKSASIGTIGVVVSNKKDKNNKFASKFKKIQNLTTPDICRYYQILNELYKEDIQYVFVEASSGGIDQDRVGGVISDISVFNNFTLDHLDYHKTEENYFECKTKLFTDYTNKICITKDSILNKIKNDLPIKYKEIIKKDILLLQKDFGFRDVLYKNGKTKFVLYIKSNVYNISINSILPVFQVENISFCVALLSNCGISENDIINQIENISPPSGRMEHIINIENGDFFVDYAHTEDALEKTLKSAKDMFKKKKILAIFGCGGNRDNAKRKKMAKVAEDFADYIIITNDNPRDEDEDLIINEIKSGFGDIFLKSNKFHIQKDRKLAIKESLDYVKSNENYEFVVIVAGKGHEVNQYISDGKIIHHNDKDEILSLIS